jgi:nucleotide-binding universal stress UspA family protein
MVDPGDPARRDDHEADRIAGGPHGRWQAAAFIRILDIVGGLAESLHSHVLGVAMWQPIRISCSDAYGDLHDARTGLEAMTAWLGGHGISAQALPVASTGDDAARLNLLATEQNADLIVAGAYAHSRLQDWILGGITRDLLLHTDLCSMASH